MLEKLSEVESLERKRKLRLFVFLYLLFKKTHNQKEELVKSENKPRQKKRIRLKKNLTENELQLIQIQGKPSTNISMDIFFLMNKFGLSFNQAIKELKRSNKNKPELQATIDATKHALKQAKG